MAAINDIDTSVTLGLRRLSTWSTGRAPTGHLFATHWTWSWQDEYNQWIKYGEKSGSSSIDSDQLEKEYQNYLDKTAEGIVSFTSGHHEYILQFKTMQQQNTKYKTKRAVRRRPKFMSRDDVQDIIRQGPSRPTCTGSTTVAVAAAKGSSTYYVPDHWDLTGDDYGDYRLVDIHPTGKTAREYNDVTTKFYKTIPRTTRITRIVRVQNEELWDHHTRKERWMMKKNMDRKVEERHLFHGTRHEFVDAICQQNFDWRVSGTSSGTAYGKGSYFARDATYSHNYTRPDTNGIYQMFLARVLVGSYTAGNEDLVKPPPKNPSNPFGDSYDSCVNSTSDPSIYIIFDNSQTYPQYVISYK
uniref:Poly [ADP-ribose] polymerase n=1 Tax=Saccoglossus kowalevskii TaxID=10224 RepID=A0ABM0MQS4_SACKO|nr:PREDICTED: poly [ADP-ribose] polymerase 12-like [Saccoglossus kowalevskii]